MFLNDLNVLILLEKLLATSVGNAVYNVIKGPSYWSGRKTYSHCCTFTSCCSCTCRVLQAWHEGNETSVHFQVSQLTFVPTLVARPSPSVCLTTGRSSLETQWTLQPSLVLLSLRHANARVSRKVSQPWTTTWTNCKSLQPSWFSPHSTFPKKFRLHCGTGLYSEH